MPDSHDVSNPMYYLITLSEGSEGLNRNAD
jgi:hypothetical protein